MDELETGPEPLVTVQVSHDPAGTPLVTLTGELDSASLDGVETALAPLLASPPRRLIVDVAGLRFADSSAIALWVRWAASVEEFELRDPTPLLRRVIDLMGLAETMGLRP